MKQYFYVVDFFKNIVKKKNIGVGIWLFINSFIIVAFLIELFKEILKMDNVFPYMLGIGLYCVILWISLSPLGEGIVRYQNGCKEIKRKEYLDRLEPLFYEVYEGAKCMTPNLSEDIQIYMYDADDINAFATGRRTICVSKGLLGVSDKCIKGVLAHEFGHLAHKDIDEILIAGIGDFIITAYLKLAKLVVQIFIGIFSLFLGLFCEDWGLANGIRIAGAVMDYILGAIIFVWVRLGLILCQHSRRQNEKLADEFAYNMGYGMGLCEVLNQINSPRAKGMWAALVASHPSSEDRISHLQEIGCPYYL